MSDDPVARLHALEGKISAARNLALSTSADSFMECVRITLREEAGIEQANLATSLVMRDLRAHLGRALGFNLEAASHGCPRCGHAIAHHWPNANERHTTACVVCLDGDILTGPADDRGVCCVPRHRILREIT